MTVKKSGPDTALSFSPCLSSRLRSRLSAPVIRRAAAIFLRRCRVKAGSLSLVFVSGRTMRALNRTYLGHDHVTDIVTFDLSASASFEGELVICPAEAERNARLFGEPFEREVLRYVAHGILHLCGHDDRTTGQRTAMRREEDKLLALVWP